MSRGLRFLLGLTPDGVTPLITIDTYFGYAMAMLLIFGLAFELPLVLVMLNMAGVVSHAFIRKWRRVMIFLVFVFAGAATPEPGPVLDAAAGRPVRDPGGAGRVVRLAERPPPGAPSRLRCWPPRACPRLDDSDRDADYRT